MASAPERERIGWPRWAGPGVQHSQRSPCWQASRSSAAVTMNRHRRPMSRHRRPMRMDCAFSSVVATIGQRTSGASLCAPASKTFAGPSTRQSERPGLVLGQPQAAIRGPSDAGGRIRTCDTRIMIEDRQGSPGSEGGSQASEGDLSSPESREFGARSGARPRRKRKRRKS
jgi:hypothetical protein